MRPFRFGANLLSLSSADDWAVTCRQVENLGYDVLLVPDHLGIPAPFPALVAAAAHTRLRVGTFVLNAGFYNPTVLARDAATTDQLTGGRLELGLGTGYVQAEFEAAGIDPGTTKDRIDRLEALVARLCEILRDPATTPPPHQQPPPLLLGGNGDRMLRLAARHADIVGFTGAAYDPTIPDGLRILTADAFADRVAFFEKAAGERNSLIERNLLIQMVVVTDEREAAIRAQSHMAPYLTTDELLDVPILLVGTVGQIVEQVRRLRDDHGISYLTVLQPSMDAFAPVLQALRSE